MYYIKILCLVFCVFECGVCVCVQEFKLKRVTKCCRTGLCRWIKLKVGRYIAQNTSIIFE